MEFIVGWKFYWNVKASIVYVLVFLFLLNLILSPLELLSICLDNIGILG